MKTLNELGISPVPWNVCTIYPAVQSINAEDVCDLSDNENVSEDSRLIAAAPELYEAIVRLYNAVVGEWEGSDVTPLEITAAMHDASVAIAKAGGAE